MLGNLIDNAIKFSPDGGCIGVELALSDGSLAFSISDEGPGIPPAERERIFDRFSRLDPSQTKGVGGSELGLFICRQLVERIGGTISVGSAPGGGARFTVERPLEC